jgi:hypothetical protein
LSSTKELRGLAPSDLVVALDAIAMAKGQDRNALVNHVLNEFVQKYLHELTVVTSALRGNPLLTEARRRDGE